MQFGMMPGAKIEYIIEKRGFLLALTLHFISFEQTCFKACPVRFPNVENKSFGGQNVFGGLAYVALKASPLCMFSKIFQVTYCSPSREILKDIVFFEQ